MLNTGTDISKAVFSEGEWHIVPAEHVNSWVSKDKKSVIVHECSLWKDVPTKEGVYWKQYGYWSLAEHVDKPCKLCLCRPPAAIVQLFMLHNFDTFAGDDRIDREWVKLPPTSRFQIQGRSGYFLGVENEVTREMINCGPDE